MRMFENLLAHLDLFRRGAGLALLAINASSFALADQYGDFTYQNRTNHIVIEKYTGPNGDVTIPKTIENLPVTAHHGR